MAKTLQIDLELGIGKARAALQQLQQEANKLAQVKGGGSSTGGGSGGGGLGGLGLNAASAAAGAAAAALAAVGAELKALASRAVELSQSASSANSQLGQLRSSIEKSNIAKDAASTSPAVISIAKASADFQKEFATAIAAAGNTPQERMKALQEKIGAGLGGEDQETWRRMKESRSNLETDIAHQRQALDVSQFRQNRDYALQIRQFTLDSSRQKQDLDIQNQRQQYDYTVAKTKFEEDQAGKMAAKQYDLSRKFATQSFVISQGRSIQDYNLNRQDRAYDFGLSQSRNQQEFNISQSRNMQGRQNQLQDMALGGATGIQYFQAARDFNQQQTYAQQDFQRQKQYATQDYALTNFRDARNQGIQLQRGAQDFSIQGQQAAASRNLEIENHLYERKYESLQLETEHARALQDINKAYERLGQDISLGKQRLQNQGSDLAYDQSIANRDFGIDTSRKLRDSNYQFQDFAGAERAKDPLAAVGQAAKDSTFAGALSQNATATGQEDLFKQVNSSIADSFKGPGNDIGSIFKTVVVDALQNTIESLNPQTNPKFLSLDPRDWFKQYPNTPKDVPDTGVGNYFYTQGFTGLSTEAAGLAAKGLFSTASNKPNITITGGNNTITVDPGLQGQIQAAIDEGDQKTQSNIMDIIRKYYSG